MFYNFNGDFVDGSRIELNVHNRALNYGDGVFESMRFSHGKIHFWEDHYFRLMAAMRIVRMQIPLWFTPEYISDLVNQLTSRNNLSNARVKLLVFRKEGGKYAPISNEVDFLLTVAALPSAAYHLNEQGLQIDLFTDFYKSTGLLSNLKSSSAQFFTVAAVFKQENDLDECLVLNHNKYVVEAISSNVFLLQQGKLVTPPISDGCLKGIIRKKIIELAPKQGIEVIEKSFSPFELQRSEAVFLTNSSAGVQWVSSFRKKTFVNDKAEVLIAALNRAAILGF